MMVGLRQREQVVVADEVARAVGEALTAVARLVGTVALDRRTHRAVEHHDPLAQDRRQRGGGVGRGRCRLHWMAWLLSGWRYGQPRNVVRHVGQASHMVAPGRVGRSKSPTGCSAAAPLGWAGDRDRGRRTDLVAPVVIAAFEGWNDAADAASSVGGPPHRGVGGRGHRRDRPRGVLRLPGQPADRRHRRQRLPPAHLAHHAHRVASPGRPRPRRHPGARHRAQHEVAPVLRRAPRRLRRPRRPSS